MPIEGRTLAIVLYLSCALGGFNCLFQSASGCRLEVKTCQNTHALKSLKVGSR